MNKSTLAFVAMALTLPLGALAADNDPDAAFYKKAAEGGITEVELGKLAEDKAQTQSVKDFGARMVHDHGAANEKLKAIAARKNIDLPSSPSVGEMATKAKLEVLSGDSFDKSYIKGMIEDHREDIREFQHEASAGRDPDAKAFAAATLPTLKEHLRMIESIASAQGVSAGRPDTASSNGG